MYIKESFVFLISRIYEKLNDQVNAAIAYDKYTQDQKLIQGSSNNFVIIKQLKIVAAVFKIYYFIKGPDLSQAYSYLANYYFKKGRLDNAYEAATKCLEFPEVLYFIRC